MELLCFSHVCEEMVADKGTDVVTTRSMSIANSKEMLPRPPINIG